LEPVFNNLRSIHLAYILGEAGKDHPYWYNERTHVGLLAAAVWLSGGTALEEFKAEKEHKNKGTRCDLWIRTNKAAFECEAKHLWLNLEEKTEDLILKLGKKLHLAVQDVRSLEKHRGLAFCFAIPGIHCESKKRDTLDKLVHDLIESTKNPIKNPSCDALVWIGFKKERNPMGNPCLLPGLLLAIKEVK
jgi:hypothetical protein